MAENILTERLIIFNILGYVGMYNCFFEPIHAEYQTNIIYSLLSIQKPPQTLLQTTSK